MPKEFYDLLVVAGWVALGFAITWAGKKAEKW